MILPKRVALVGGVLLSAMMVLWACGAKLVRIRHESPAGCWARSLVLASRYDQPKLEFVYWAWHSRIGIAWHRESEVRWLGWAPYPGEEPTNF